MLKIKTWLDGLGRKQPVQECPFWPPDLFAIAGTLLKRSGAYLRLFEQGSRSRLSDVKMIADEWRRQIDTCSGTVDASVLGRLVPRSIISSWNRVFKARNVAISSVRDSNELTELLLQLTLISDECCSGMGIDSGGKNRAFLALADQALTDNSLRSFCWDIPVDVICVLGKQHTPQNGATFRSLTHHLALYLPNDIEARWVNRLLEPPRNATTLDVLNLLLLPWPTEVESADFAEAKKPGGASTSCYFRFDPRCMETASEFRQRFERAIDQARKHSPAIDAIVLPELALTPEQYKIAERIAVREKKLLISGVRKNETSGPPKQDRNVSKIQAAGRLPKERGKTPRSVIEAERLVQDKHHRWRLDRDQIVNYQLAGKLPLKRGCWENIELPHRLLHFLTLNQMTWSVLICEDLARQDPAADLIRAVGPNLLIALLMDGPQLAGRWPSRYASVLADDPGTSVLTLSSLGMVKRSRPITRTTNRRAEASRVIALWRDASLGEVEISLDPHHDACVLTLENRLIREWTADGRDDGEQTRQPTFAGFRSFQIEN